MFLEKLTKNRLERIIERLRKDEAKINSSEKLKIEINLADGSFSYSIQSFYREENNEM